MSKDDDMLIKARGLTDPVKKLQASEKKTRTIEKLFLSMGETILSDRHKVLSRLCSMRDEGILTDDDLRYMTSILLTHYQKRICSLNVALNAAIDGIATPNAA